MKLSKNWKMFFLVLVLVGALNWGLVGLFGFNLVSFLLGDGLIANIVYSLVGVGALVVGYDELM